jgi:hypothetical protein
MPITSEDFLIILCMHAGFPSLSTFYNVRSVLHAWTASCKRGFSATNILKNKFGLPLQTVRMA